MEQKDGGPAYPIPSDGRTHSTHPGMSLRDHFAGLAMQGSIAATDDEWIQSKSTREYMAKTYYAMADAMIRARETGA